MRIKAKIVKVIKAGTYSISNGLLFKSIPKAYSSSILDMANKNVREILSCLLYQFSTHFV